MTVPTTDAGEKLQAVAAAIATAVGAISGVTALAYDPIGQDLHGPTVVVGGMSGERIDLGFPEQEQGSVDWLPSFAVTLYVPMDDPETAWSDARGYLGQIIQSIDGQPTLGGEVQEAKVYQWSLAPNDPDQPRRMLLGTCTVRVKLLMPDVVI